MDGAFDPGAFDSGAFDTGTDEEVEVFEAEIEATIISNAMTATVVI